MRAIDVHAHVGEPWGFPQKGKESEFLALSVEELESCCGEAGIGMVFASPMEGIFPFGSHTVMTANERMRRLAVRVPWMYQWVVVHPRLPETFAQAARMLKDKKCVGIKIHPDAHGYQISDCGGRIFEFASEYGAVVETHSGDRNSLPEDFVVFADRYPDVKIILSHLGNNCDGDVTHHVRAMELCRHGNLYTDVSSARSILFRLVEWAAAEVGAERILFGTDSPLHHVGMMKSRIDYSSLTTKQKEQILYKNAEHMFAAVFEKGEQSHAGGVSG